MQLLARLDGNRQRADQLVDSIVFNPYGKASIGNLNPWNHNPRAWDEARDQMGKLIEEAASRH
jgi:hypothetical protein